MSNEMTIVFGKDQEATIDDLLDELKPTHVLEYSKKDMDLMVLVQYVIKFKSMYSAYLFGHNNQAKHNFLTTRDGSRISL